MPRATTGRRRGEPLPPSSTPPATWTRAHDRSWALGARGDNGHFSGHAPVRPIERIAAVVDGVRWKSSGNGFMARCPSHSDREASLSVDEADDERALVRCFAGCTAATVIAACGLSWSDCFADVSKPREEPNNRKKPPRVEDLGVPTPTQVEALTTTRRIQRPADLAALGVRRVRVWGAEWCGFPTLAGSWKLWAVNADGRPRLDESGRLVRRNVLDSSLVLTPALRAALTSATSPVRFYDVEGESDLLALVSCAPEVAALTGTGGASNLSGHELHRETLECLASSKVVIIRDRDDAGRQGAAKAANFWQSRGAIVSVLELPEALGEKGDLRDYLLGKPSRTGTPAAEALGTFADLEKLAEVAVAWKSTSDEASGDTKAGHADDHLIAQLAALSPLAYDRRRQAEADRLGVRVGTLDAEVDRRRHQSPEDPSTSGGGIELRNPEPSASPVDGAELLETIRATYRKHLILSEHADVALALWTLFAWVIDSFTIAPLLAVVSPEKRCGKTTLLHLLHALTPRALFASNITPAALYRAVERYRPTLVIDEADTFLRGSDELRGVLNAGHTRTSAVVIRTVGDEHEPRTFSVWCPKAIAMIGRLPDTLEDRAIVMAMHRRAPSDPVVARLRLDRLHSAIGPDAMRWATDHTEALRQADPTVPEELHDRAADNWRPLLAIADQAGGWWPDAARVSARALSGVLEATDATRGVALLRDMRDIVGTHEHVTSEALLAALLKLDEAPWSTWNKGRPISPRQVAALLRPFGIRSQQVHPENVKGYQRQDCADAFRRYLPADPNVPKDRNGDGELSETPEANGQPCRSDHTNESTGGNGTDCSARSDTDGFDV